jgi:insertion element IS1 protein InsB
MAVQGLRPTPEGQRQQNQFCCAALRVKPPRGEPLWKQETAVLLYTLGLSMNAIAQQLGVSTPSILNWIRAHAATHAPRPQPEPGGNVVVMELDELWPFIKKKTPSSGSGWLFADAALRVIALADDSWTGNAAIVMPPRSIGCWSAWRQAPQERWRSAAKGWNVTLYGTDEFAPSASLLPIGRHYRGKDHTGASERVNSRLRHCFARFRRRTCVVSKAIDMVDATIALFAAYHVNGTGAKLTLPLPA